MKFITVYGPQYTKLLCSESMDLVSSGKKGSCHFMRPAPDFRPSSLALSVADSTALIVAALTPPCSRV